jgi:hypothetical protein
MVLPETIKQVLGFGYDVTGRYADSQNGKKKPILNLSKLLEKDRVVQDVNSVGGEFETIAGEDIKKYQDALSTKVSASATGGLEKVASFSAEVGTNFSTERASDVRYAFATSTICIAKAGYVIRNRNGLDEFFTDDFKNDLTNKKCDEIIRIYGTHVMLGGILGARLDYHFSSQKKIHSRAGSFGAYAKAKAEATIEAVKAGGGVSFELDKKYSEYFETDETRTKTSALGGKPEYAHHIHSKQEYGKWLDTIENNQVWCDYYPGSLVPLCDLVRNANRSKELAAAIKAYCDSKGIVVKNKIEKKTHTVNSGQIAEKALLLGGDENINSKKGRDTGWSLNVVLDLTDRQTSGAYRAVEATYTYTVDEKAKNYTTLEFIAKRTYGLNRDIVELVGVTTETVTGIIRGGTHSYTHTGAVASTLLKNIFVKIDGKGGDLNNIGFFADLRIEFNELLPA